MITRCYYIALMKTSATWSKRQQHCFHLVLLKADSRRTSLIIMTIS